MPLALFVAATAGVTSAEPEDIESRAALVKLELNQPSRSAEEKGRDRNRVPRETLGFFGLRDDMRVIELFPGEGWYTRLLAPFLAQNGTLYVAMGTGRVEEQLNTPGLSKVVPTGKVVNFTKTDSPGYIYSVDSIDFEQTGVDMVLTFRNAHNLDSAGRISLSEAAFAALKPGGVFGVVDHTKRHMEAFSKATWRRTDPVQIIKEALAAGFEFVDYSDLHARPEDGLEFDTRHESLVNESDRYTLKFTKPN